MGETTLPDPRPTPSRNYLTAYPVPLQCYDPRQLAPRDTSAVRTSGTALRSVTNPIGALTPCAAIILRHLTVAQTSRRGALLAEQHTLPQSSLLPLLAASRLVSRLLQADKLPCDFHHTAL